MWLRWQWPKNGMKIRHILALANFSMACFDERGEQIPELQSNLLILWAEHAERAGHDPNGLVVETPMGALKIVRSTGGWNLELA